jgi:hypothetical protein
MYTYINLTTREYPVYEGDLRFDFPAIQDHETGDTFPCPQGFARVVQTEPPSFSALTQYIEEGAPVCVDGVWQTTWIIKRQTDRNKLLAIQFENTEENAKIQRELRIAELAIQNETDVSRVALWQEFYDALTTFWNTYPRPEVCPRMPAALFATNANQDLTAPGSAPNVIE